MTMDIKKPRKVDAIFDYETQQYYNAAGEALEEQDGWDFPCNLCQGPAKFTHCNAYYEYHDCLNCGNEVRVN